MAPSKGGIRVEGVREVQAAMKKLQASSADLKVAHQAVATVLLPGVTQRTPRRTGELAASWQARSTKTRARITSTLRRAGPIEYGWPAHNVAAARMVRDTVDASHSEIIDTYSVELGKLAAHEGFGVKS